MPSIQQLLQDPNMQTQFALVYAPRRQRSRFPENCVECVATQDIALERADPDKKRYPAQVSGPSRSSEGVNLYYLVQWLG
ncbi:hypothetical protein [Candidatus Venteria ishoeyi]|uniref:Uncharacterized protein n=1 Tax=Candidatus Venteria ishoeyi TaxID=1899563 RepID=A0A1H6FEB1_9GAMM|nr:hypothetical protein [Candidatus Venteria ishoeyi]SEH07741.1 Uncharacterised protein [Candidatus Venteria ishoeyi]